MSKVNRVFLISTSGLLTTLAVYLLIRFVTEDLPLSLVPGWHTTIYPPSVTYVILTALFLVSSLLIYAVFKIFIRLVLMISSKLK